MKNGSAVGSYSVVVLSVMKLTAMVVTGASNSDSSDILSVISLLTCA